jgi:release factor glutamine methyltransferase
LDPESTETYLPSDDTALLIRALSRFGGGSCLEIGFGSGAVLRSLVPRFAEVVGTDILTPGQARLAKGPAEVVLADRASCFREKTFDLVAFNPPYLPSGAITDAAVDGGPGGVEVPMAFLDDALRVVKEGGMIVALLSDQGDLNMILSRCAARGLTVKEEARSKLFYESLVVYVIRRG